MTEETPGFEQKPDVPADAVQPDDAAAQAAGQVPADEAGGPADPAGDVTDDEQEGQDVLQGGQGQDAQVAALTAQLDQTRTALHERTQDLQRLQAEFQNYRRRVERDRAAVKEVAVANLLTELLPVLDDIGRARDHGELVGGFKSVAESLEMVAAKMGLMQFGKEGEPFDPTVHEALMHSYSPDVTETTCVQILQPGYRIGERTIRPARVGVAEPQPGAQGAAGEESADEEENGGPDQG
ncbi:molecular chaperone GrpE [Streptomyces abyssalis]|uniref:Protein GrpE n=1 Tax=Streptomyces abyssalis TaxID=933944 RepID=A0A1E7JPA5_9ACTN|nr:nucleotide exchange factor GrpE [Streptomyces abyssalis]OEU86499.1 molecular chaperone GrpE [Streptomyces abyssalis]OEU90111.1 molecular chaperone GrpE [Streptomyces abyssalis]OEV29077.1 molecular chaperone GrpE [Streptomyces nanshensis]